MYHVVETAAFTQWIGGLRDLRTRLRLLRRVERARRGLLGDCKPVGQGVWEMREDFGPGWRMYYCMQGATLIFMLGGGDKGSQSRDIAHVKTLARALEVQCASLEKDNAHHHNPPV